MKYKETLRFNEKYLEDSRLFMVTKKQIMFLYNHIGVEEGMKVVDLGCGSGYFTRQMAKRLKTSGKVFGVDINQKLVKAAKLLAKSESLYNVEYSQGNALKLQFPDNYFDLSTCHFLLSRLPKTEPISVIKEMIRVTKVRGKISAIEPCLGAMSAMYSSDYRLSSLLTNVRKAKSFVQKEVLGIDENIGIRLPEIFSGLGLTSITTELMAFLWWTPYPLSLSDLTDETRNWYKRRMRALAEPENLEVIDHYGKICDAASVLRNTKENGPSVFIDQYKRLGITDNDFRELKELRIEYITNLLYDDHPNKFINDIEIIPVFAVSAINKKN